MKLTLSLSTQDYIAFNLYYYSKTNFSSKRQKKKANLFSIYFFVLAILMYYLNNRPFAIGLLTIGVLYFLYVQFYYSSLIKKSLEKNTALTVEGKVDKPYTIEFFEDELKTNSVAGYATVYFSDLDKIVELPNYFYIYFKTVDTLIIPKPLLGDVTETRKYFQILCHNKNKDFVDDLAWKWK